jgi:hypothetical protein
MSADPADGPATDDPPASLAWQVTPDSRRLLHVLAYGLLAPLGAVALTLLVGGVAFAAFAVRDGSWTPLLLLGVAVVIALARPPVLAAMLSDETEASFGHEDWHPSRRGLLTASVLCGGAMLAASLHSRIAVVAVAVLSFGAGLLAMTLSTDAVIDDDRRLETQYSTAALSTLSGVRSIDLGDLTVFWLVYARGADGFRNPRVLAVPRGQATRVREALDAGVDADPNADPIGRAERAVVALFGLGVLATGPALWLLIGDAGAGAVVLAYAVTLSAVFAGPMLWYAWNG